MGVHPTALHIRPKFPEVFKPLVLEKARYKVFWGGRGGAKSWQFAREILLRGLKGGLRVLCTREVQSSLKESVKQLLADQIKSLGLEAFYKILDAEIRGPKGTLIIFKGLGDPEALKSAEGVDLVWIEEARTVTKASWTKLDFTIRKPGAEIWISFNPELETDYLYELFVKNKPPPSSIVVKVSYLDNPWISKDFVRQADHLKETDYDEWLWAIGGNCRVALEGAVYVNELRKAQLEGRLTGVVPLERSKPVHTFWDLGRGDATAIWFVQIVGFQYRILAYYQSSGHDITHYIEKLEEMRKERGWIYGITWLPHDADNKLLGEKRTVKRQVEDAGYKVKITPKLPVHEGINAARTIFDHAFFDETGCAEGINCLRQYHYDVDEKTGARSRLPDHDWSSLGADAWRYVGVALKEEVPKVRVKLKKRDSLPAGRSSWMAR